MPLNSAWCLGSVMLSRSAHLCRHASTINATASISSIGSSSASAITSPRSSQTFATLNQTRKDSSVNSVELARQLAMLNKTGGLSAKYVPRLEPKTIAPRISPQMDGLKRKFFLLVQSSKHEEALDLFMSVMREGMATINVGQDANALLPHEYRPDMELVHSLLNSLRKVYAPPPAKRSGPADMKAVASRSLEMAGIVKECMAIMKASGLEVPSYLSMLLLRALVSGRSVDPAYKLYQSLLAEGTTDLFPSITTALAGLLLYDRRLLQAWSILDEAITRGARSQGADNNSSPGTPIEPAVHNLRVTLPHRVLRTAMYSQEDKLVAEIMSALEGHGIPVDPDIYNHILLMAARADDLDKTEEALEALLARLSKETSGSTKMSEGTALMVLNAAVRAYDPDISPQLVKSVVALLQNEAKPTDDVETAEDPPTPSPECSALSPATHHAIIHAHVCGKDWGGAMNALHDLELSRLAAADKGGEEHITQTLSPFHGLRYFAEALIDEATVAMAYDQLTQRQAQGQPITLPMMNVILRGLARTGAGAVDSAGRLFEEYFSVGLSHDVDAYNSVIESCALAGKPQTVEALMKYMESQAVKPDLVTYDLWMTSFVEADDCDGFLVASRSMQDAKFRPKVVTLKAAIDAANRQNNVLAADTIFADLRELYGGKDSSRQPRREEDWDNNYDDDDDGDGGRDNYRDGRGRRENY